MSARLKQVLSHTFFKNNKLIPVLLTQASALRGHQNWNLTYIFFLHIFCLIVGHLSGALLVFYLLHNPGFSFPSIALFKSLTLFLINNHFK